MVHLPKRLASCLTLAAVGMLLVASRPAQAYPVLLLGGFSTPQGKGLLFPLLFVSGDGKALSPYLYGAVGLSEHLDIFAGVSGNFGLFPGSASFGQVDVIPRYLVTPQVAVSPRIIYTPGNSLVFSPEVHATGSFGELLLSLNAGVRPQLDVHGGGLTSTTAFAYVSGSYFLSKQLWLVLEADPSLSFVHRTATEDSSVTSSVLVAPGVGFAVDPEQSHMFELAAVISVPTSAATSFHYRSSVTYVLWYVTSFTLWEK
jgi:hypothetical protein